MVFFLYAVVSLIGVLPMQQKIMEGGYNGDWNYDGTVNEEDELLERAYNESVAQKKREREEFTAWCLTWVYRVIGIFLAITALVFLVKAGRQLGSWNSDRPKSRQKRLDEENKKYEETKRLIEESLVEEEIKMAMRKDAEKKYSESIALIMRSER